MELSRVTREGNSRTTRDNTRQMTAVLCGGLQQPLLLVTSAWHMFPAVPEFEAVGCRVMPFQADFRSGFDTPWIEYSLASSLVLGSLKSARHI